MSVSPAIPQHQLFRSRNAVREWVWAARQTGARVGVVMTMGALHAGHLSLVEASRAACDRTVVTVFVNPTQFLPGEDWEVYPRTWESDCAQLACCGVDGLFAPSVHEMYGSDHSTFVQPPRQAEMWEGVARPGHFRGVCTIVLKLLQAVPAQVAFFGQKDYQQYLVVRQMVRDLDVPVDVRLCPTVREVDGLAMSSRNRYLSPEERQQALSLHRGLQAARGRLQQGERRAPQLIDVVVQSLRASGVGPVDYIAVADTETLAELSLVEREAQLLVAARVGATRLLDNIRLAVPG